MRESDQYIDRIYVNQAVRSSDYRMVQNHFHNYFELFYVKQGGCTFFIGGSIFELHAGDYIVIPPNIVHYNRYFSQCVRINIYFREEDLDARKQPAGQSVPESSAGDGLPASDVLSQSFAKATLVHIPSAHRSRFEELFSEMINEDKLDDQYTGGVLQLQFRQLMLFSKRYCIVRTLSSSGFYETDKAIIEAAKYITSQFQQPITLESLSKQAGLSPTYFSKRFRVVTGMGMKEFLSSIRLTNASMELLSTDHTITEVAFNNGFSDSNYFKDAFKKQYGCSPRAYRKNASTDRIHAYTLSSEYQGDHIEEYETIVKASKNRS